VARLESLDLRGRRLRRMKIAATGLLVVVTAAFVASSVPAARWPAAAYVRAFAEAAMVGACADWFAVTALFRRPFGLPIPHTAIIPRNKDRIGQALGRFVVENFLSARVLDAKLRQLQLGAWGGAWLQDPANAKSVADRVLVWGPQLMQALPAGALEDLAGAVAIAVVRGVPAAPTASALLSAVWNEGAAQPIIERVAALLSNYLEEHQGVILEQVQSQSGRWMPGWVDRTITRKIMSGLVQLLEDVQRLDHPWRVELGEAVDRLIVRLATDPELRRQGERLKERLLDQPGLREHAHRLWREVERQLKTQWSDETLASQDRIERLIVDLGAWLSHDPVVQRTLNTGARALMRQILAPRREAIGRFIGQVVESWDARSVVERLELQVGPDLQFIRINGTVVGGLIGLGLFTLSRLLHWQ
jgi:uncharacterized membrane-anchored protein YjiN (DUF445 family)